MWRPYNKISILSLLLTVNFLLLASCAQEKSSDEIIPKEELTQMFIEFYLAEARLNSYSIPRDSALKLFIPFEDKMLKKYGVSDSTLKHTYQYYFDHPIELEKLYETVIDSLSLRERKASKQAPTN